ncbi:MAG: hypothetical protein WC803_10055 [Sphingomonas sp.]
MSDHTNSHWRNMFDQGRGNSAPPPRTRPAPPPGYDDGYQPPPHSAAGNAPLAPSDVTDEAAMALAHDPTNYKPWILQRGRSRPAMMLHLRRFEPKSGLWMGWQMSYPHLIAVEYTGDTMLSLDFGTRQFVIEGTGLTELARHLQIGSVLMVQEYAQNVWLEAPDLQFIRSVRIMEGER